MAQITLKGNTINTCGELPTVGTQVSDFALVNTSLAEVKLSEIGSGHRVLNIFPSIDTPVCATSVREFNKKASSGDSVVLNISMDLPFAHKRFCGAEGLEGVESLSAFRSNFAKELGLEIIDGPLTGLCSRAVIVLDSDNKVVYSEQVPEIAQEPNYDAALASLK